MTVRGTETMQGLFHRLLREPGEPGHAAGTLLFRLCHEQATLDYLRVRQATPELLSKHVERVKELERALERTRHDTRRRLLSFMVFFGRCHECAHRVEDADGHGSCVRLEQARALLSSPDETLRTCSLLSLKDDEGHRRARGVVTASTVN